MKRNRKNNLLTIFGSTELPLERPVRVGRKHGVASVGEQHKKELRVWVKDHTHVVVNLADDNAIDQLAAAGVTLT